MSPNDSCRLISIYLPAFVVSPFTDQARFNWSKFLEVVGVAMRLSDDLVDLELEKLYAIRKKADTPDEKELFTRFIEACENGRRTGLGTHGLADALARLGIKYDTGEAVRVIDQIYGLLKLQAYSTSVAMAKERGAFPIWNWDTEKDNEFIKRIAITEYLVDGVLFSGRGVIDSMQKYGRRNGSLLTNAPTGSVSILSKNCSSGIEPVFMNSYSRRRKVDVRTFKGDLSTLMKDATGDFWESYEVFHSNVDLYRQITGNTGELPDYFVTSAEIDPLMRVKVQAAIQRHVDHSLSSTINLPRETQPQTIADIYMAAWKSGCKGVTVYRDGSRDGVLVATEAKEAAPEVEPEVEELRAEIELLEEQVDILLRQIATQEREELKARTTRGRATSGKMTKANFINVAGEERKVYVYVGTNEFGEVVETFVIDEQGDEELKPYAAALGKLTSLLLKYGIPDAEIEDTLSGLKGGSVSYGARVYQSVPDLVAKLIQDAQPKPTYEVPIDAGGIDFHNVSLFVDEEDERRLVTSFTTTGTVLDTGSTATPTVEIPSIPGASKCPKCKAMTLVDSGGCPTCHNCGYARCA